MIRLKLWGKKEDEEKTNDTDSGKDSGKGKYIITYERKACIGAGVCAAVADKHWVMAQDGKADLVDSQKEDREGKEIWTRDIGEDELDVNKQAAEGCPAVVIHIYNKETGEKIF